MLTIHFLGLSCWQWLEPLSRNCIVGKVSMPEGLCHAWQSKAFSQITCTLLVILIEYLEK